MAYTLIVGRLDKNHFAEKQEDRERLIYTGHWDSINELPIPTVEIAHQIAKLCNITTYCISRAEDSWGKEPVFCSQDILDYDKQIARERAENQKSQSALADHINTQPVEFRPAQFVYGSCQIVFRPPSPRRRGNKMPIQPDIKKMQEESHARNTALEAIGNNLTTAELVALDPNKVKASNEMYDAIIKLLIESTPPHYNDEQQAKRLHISVNTLLQAKAAITKAGFCPLPPTKGWEEPPIPSGMKRAYCVCGTCGEPQWYDYVPFSLSSPILTLSCHHGMTEPRYGLKDVTREEFIVLMTKKVQGKT